MLINIQFLRFAAALLVVLYHASTHVRATGVDQGFIFAAGDAVGFAGVDVFFVISGFIMFHTTTGERGSESAIQFIKRRLARIYSGYWPFFFLGAIVFWWARPDHFAESKLLGSFTLWPQSLNHVLVDVSWTLSYEMYFYILFSLLVLMGLRWRTWTLFGLLALILGFNLFRYWVLQDFSAENLHSIGFADQFLSSPFLVEFFAGALLASTIKKRSSNLGWLMLSGGLIGFFLAGWANVGYFGGHLEQGFHVVPRVILFGIPSLLILAGLIRIEQSGHHAPRKFSLATGGASYALYLCHTLFFVSTMKLGLNNALGGFGSWQVQALFLIYVCLIVAFSVAHYQFVEKSLHRRFKQFLSVKNTSGSRA